MYKRPFLVIAVVLATTASLPVIAAGDAKKGESLFAQECSDCHSATAGKHKKGPSLFGVDGRKAGTIADYANYSDALKQSGLVWAADTIDAYITHPRKFLPGGRMRYDGLSDSAARADVIAYLQSLK